VAFLAAPSPGDAVGGDAVSGGTGATAGAGR